MTRARKPSPQLAACMRAFQAHKAELLASGLTLDQIANRAERPAPSPLSAPVARGGGA